MNAKSDFDLGVLNVGVVNVLVSLSLSWGGCLVCIDQCIHMNAGSFSLQNMALISVTVDQC